jgi:hypothetical protein
MIIQELKLQSKNLWLFPYYILANKKYTRFPQRYVYVSKQFISLSNNTCTSQLAILYILPKLIILNIFKPYFTSILILELNRCDERIKGLLWKHIYTFLMPNQSTHLPLHAFPLSQNTNTANTKIQICSHIFFRL